MGELLRNTTAWGANITVVVLAITDNTHAIVNYRADVTSSGLTLLRYYMTGSSTLFTSELTEGQAVVISGVQYWVGKIVSNTLAAIYKSQSGGTVVSVSASGLTLYRKTIFEANILSVAGAHSITLDANAPRTLSGLRAFYATNSHAAWVAALATSPTAVHLVGEQSIKGAALDPGTQPLMIQGDGWSELSGQDGFAAPSLSTGHPVKGSVLRVFGGNDGIITTTPSYRKLKLQHMAMVGSGVLGSHGLFPTNGDLGVNSNQHEFTDLAVMNFDFGWYIITSEESKAPTPVTFESNRIGIEVATSSTNSQLSVSIQGSHIGLLLEAGGGLTFKGLIQDNYNGIVMRPAVGGLDEITFKQIHVEGNQMAIVPDCTTASISRLALGDGYHDFSEQSFYVITTGMGALNELRVGDATKIPYLWHVPAFTNNWTIKGGGYMVVDAGAIGLNLDHFNGVNQRAGTPEVLTLASTVTPDWTKGEPHTLLLTGNVATFAVPVNAPLGGFVTLIFTQDGTGERTVGFAAGYKGDLRVDPNGQTITAMTFYQSTAGTWKKISGTSNSANNIRTGNDGAWVMHNSTGTEASVLRAGGDAAIQLGDDTAVSGTTVNVKARSGYFTTVDGTLVQSEASGFGQFFKIHYFGHNALGATTDDMVEITNQTAAVNGTQQWSPDIAWVGQGYHSGGTPGTSETRWRAYTVPIQSSAALPDMEWRLTGTIASTIGTSPLRVRMDNDGTLKTGFNGAAPAAAPARAGQITDSTGGTPGSSCTTADANCLATLIAKINALELLLHNNGLQQ